MTVFQLGACVVSLILVLGCGACAQAGGSAGWTPALEEDFEDPAALSAWHMDGSGEATIENGTLRIDTFRREVEGGPAKASVFWHKTPFDGDVRIEFDCRAEPESRVILFFNTRTIDPEASIFDWARPQATYADYAYERRLELYSIGLLRSDQTNLNLRYLGRDIPDEWIELMPYPPAHYPERYLTPDELQAALAAVGLSELPATPAERQQLTRRGPFPELLRPHLARWSRVNESFQAASIIANHDAPEPVFADADKWYHVVVEAVGNHVTVRVDDEVVIDYVHAAREEQPLIGGHIGFRNFRPTTAWYDNLRVYTRPTTAQ